MALSGAGISTGSNTPMIRDMIGGWNGGYYTQYILIKGDGTSVSLNVGPEVITCTGGRGWGVDNLTDLSGIQGSAKAGLHILPNCNNDNIVSMHYADLPGQPGVTTNIRGPLPGRRFYHHRREEIRGDDGRRRGHPCRRRGPEGRSYLQWNGLDLYESPSLSSVVAATTQAHCPRLAPSLAGPRQQWGLEQPRLRSRRRSNIRRDE